MRQILVNIKTYDGDDDDVGDDGDDEGEDEEGDDG